MTRTPAMLMGVLMLLTLCAPSVQAQLWGHMGGWVGYGSTVQGDILRGEGVFLNGLGNYYVDTAVAGSINADTWMRVNTFLANAIRESNLEKAGHKKAMLNLRIKTHKENLERIRNNPELLDLHKGDALNALLIPLLKPGVADSAYRFATVAVPGEAIRQIPFKIGKEAATFSMDRLMARGEWPVLLRSAEFARERKAYGDAVDIALDQMVHDKLTPRALEAVRAAVRELRNRLEKVAPARREHDDLYNRAKNYLDDLEEVGRVLGIPEVERVLGAIERYHGTTVGDLMKFMDLQDVRFGVAENDVERGLYRNLYAAMLQQTDLFVAARQLTNAGAELPAKTNAKTKAKVGENDGFQ
jgi:hypothetical protein